MAINANLVRDFKAHALLTDSDATGVSGPKLLMPDALTTGGGYIVAKFRVVAGASLTIGFNSTGYLRKNGSTTTVVEEGGGRQFSKMCGYDVVVVRANPATAPTGQISVDPNPYFAAPSAALLNEGDHTGHFLSLGLAPDDTLNLVVDPNTSTGLEAHVLIYGIPA